MSEMSSDGNILVVVLWTSFHFRWRKAANDKYIEMCCILLIYCVRTATGRKFTRDEYDFLQHWYKNLYYNFILFFLSQL